MQPFATLTPHGPARRPLFVAVLEDAMGNGDELHVTCDPRLGEATIELFEAGSLSAIAVTAADVGHPAATVATTTLATELSGTADGTVRDVALAITWSVTPGASSYSFHVAGTGFVAAHDRAGYRRFRVVAVHWLTRFGDLEAAVAQAQLYRAPGRCVEAPNAVPLRRRRSVAGPQRLAPRWWAPRQRFAA